MTRSKAMKNIIDITNVSDEVLAVFLEAKSNPNIAICIDDLSANDRSDLARLMGWPESSYLSDWIGSDHEDHFDYEGAILDMQDDESWGC